MLRRTDAPRRFRFRHPIVHGAIYEDAPAGWRCRPTRGPPRRSSARAPLPRLAPARRALGEGLGDAEAAALLSEAGGAAALRAPATAAHWYASALALQPPDAEPAARLALLIPMAQALGYAGELDGPARPSTRSSPLLPADQLAVRGQVVAGCARSTS